MANDPEIPTKSIVDYVFRWGAQDVPLEQQDELGILSTEQLARLRMPRDAAERKVVWQSVEAKSACDLELLCGAFRA